MSELIQRAIDLEWGYIMFTLLIRFVGVFIVLAILMGGMYLLGFIVSRIIAKQEAEKAKKQTQEPMSISLAEEPEREADEEEMVAAMGAAIAMAMELERTQTPSPSHAGIAAGAWTMAGRALQINSRLQGGSHRHS